MKIEKPGIYDMPAADYHADPCPKPSLSSSIARELLAASPLHGWFAHPRLNPTYQREEDQKFDLGTAAHAYLLEGESGFTIVDADDWKTKAAQTARAMARLEGKVPLLTDQWTRVQEMAVAARAQLAAHEEAPIPLTAGKPEQTLVWREADVWCRARLDWLHDDRRTIDDYKSTGASANPEAWTRTMFTMGFDVQAAFYLRGLRAVFGAEAFAKERAFRFVAQENFAPYALSVIGLGPDALALAEKKVGYAIELWSECLNANRWPGYPTRTCWAQLPGWEEAKWLEREYRDLRPEQPIDDGQPIGDLLAGDNRA